MMTPRIVLALVAALLAPTAARSQQPSNPPLAPVAARYFCPMRCEGDKTYDQPGRCPVCNMKLKAVAGAVAPTKLTLELSSPKPAELQPSRPTEVSLRLVSSEPAADAPKKLADAPVHVLVASADLNWFDHEHSKVSQDGAITVTLNFPHAGPYVIFADPKTADHAMEVAPVRIMVPGDAPVATKPSVSEGPRSLAGGYIVEIDSHEPFKAGSASTLTFTVSLDGKGLSDLEPSFGSPGHLVLISQDLTRLVHAHASGVHGRDHGPATPANGPELSFAVTFPAPGLYGGWLEFQHQGKRMTAPFVFEVKP